MYQQNLFGWWVNNTLQKLINNILILFIYCLILNIIILLLCGVKCMSLRSRLEEIFSHLFHSHSRSDDGFGRLPFISSKIFY